MANSGTPPAISGLSQLADAYPFLLCDAWGVIHNGLAAYPEACSALAGFRRAGGVVLVITNAPRPKADVLAQFRRIGVDHAAFDDVVTSGEAARELLAARPGVKVFHLGPDRDLSLYDGLDLVLTGDSGADLVSCTGLRDDETETPDSYTAIFAAWAARGLPMLCVNPDKIVERGTRLVWCAGALAERYAALGGETIMVGKPHAAIYATALGRLDDLAARPVEAGRILAIGDGAETDLRGARNQGIDVLFVTGGIHAGHFGEGDEPDASLVHAFLARGDLAARAFIPRLVW